MIFPVGTWLKLHSSAQCEMQPQAVTIWCHIDCIVSRRYSCEQTAVSMCFPSVHVVLRVSAYTPPVSLRMLFNGENDS